MLVGCEKPTAPEAREIARNVTRKFEQGDVNAINAMFGRMGQAGYFRWTNLVRNRSMEVAQDGAAEMINGYVIEEVLIAPGGYGRPVMQRTLVGWPGTPSRMICIATLHPHPFEWGATYPANCGNMAGGKYNDLAPGMTGNGRASGEDWHASKTLQVPGYIVDYEGVYRYDGRNVNLLPITSGGQTIAYWATNGPQHYAKWPRVWNGCPLP